MYQYIQHDVQIHNIQALLSTKYNGWKLGMRMTVSCSNGARMCFQSMKRRQNKLCTTIFRTFSFPVNNAEWLVRGIPKNYDVNASMKVWNQNTTLQLKYTKNIYHENDDYSFFPKTSSHIGLIWRRKGILYKIKTWSNILHGFIFYFRLILSQLIQ